MKKTSVVALVILMIIAAGCNDVIRRETVSPPSASTPMPSATYLSPQPSPSPTLTPTAEVTTPPPLPTAAPDPLSEFLQAKPDPGQKISCYIVANDRYLYYPMGSGEMRNNMLIYRMDRKSKEARKHISTGLAIIDQMFLDRSGSLYYVGRRADNYVLGEAALYKYTGGKQLKIIDDITEVLYVNDYSIYYDRTYYSKDIQYTYVMQYDISNGKINMVNIPKNGRIASHPHAYCDKPLLLYGYDGSDYSYLFDLKSNRSSPPFKWYYESDDYRYIYTYEADDGALKVYRVNDGEMTTLKRPESRYGPWGPYNMRLTGKEFEFIDNNYLCVFNMPDQKMIFKKALPFQEESELFIRNTDDTCYLLFQDPLAWEEGGGDRWPVKVKLRLYTFDLDTHDLKRIWVMNTYNNKGMDVEIDIEAGYVWFFVTSAQFDSYFMKVALGESSN